MTNPLTIDDAAAELQAELDILGADAALAESRADERDPYNWLPTWFLAKLAELDAAEQAIAEHAARLAREIEARRKALLWRWGRELQQQVTTDLRAQGGKRKSVTYPTGRAGFRASTVTPHIIVDDEPTAVAAAEIACPAAIVVMKMLRISPLLKHFQETGEELPGTHYDAGHSDQKFFAGKVTLGVKELPNE